ncbi:MAG: dihydrofolate reductase [Firmicutes bacterium]|nr:dihydrofolate reductase [Bacillota bacterium]
MNTIVAVDEKWGIGCDGKLLYDIPEDMKFFREMTDGKVVVMGLTTLKSLPNSKPLKNRVNIVLSYDKDEVLVDPIIVCHSIEELLKEVKKYKPEDVFVIGGQAIYRQLLDYCDTAYITKVKSTKKADTFFPDVDKLNNWTLESKSEEKEHNGLKYVFCKYVRV